SSKCLSARSTSLVDSCGWRLTIFSISSDFVIAIPSLRTKPGNKPSQIMQLGFCFCKHCLFFALFSSPLGLWERAMPANPALRAGPGRHCVTAFCGLQPLFELSLRGSLCGALPPRPDVRRGISLPTSLARVPAVTRFARPSGQPSAVQFCSNKIVHAPGHSFGVIQTMLLVLVNSGLERMGRKNRSGCAGQIVCASPVSRQAYSDNRMGRVKPQRLRRVCRSDIFVTIRVVKPAYTALMFIGPPLAGIRGHGPLPHCCFKSYKHARNI